MPVGIFTFTLRLIGCSSLKEKRGRLKPILHSLQRHYNLSTAETGHQDAWQQSEITCALACSDARVIERVYQQVKNELALNWPEEPVFSEQLEIVS
ncbi:MAG TPA: DUF503 domain-containing protein [Anaerolineaceae bacterium]|nr:DUF503 domain-containing protein [Anaerolineaceae bacterium]HPN50141.1 DUF503 domain-containing protein [Anaerolineaceae bacterium]